MPPPIPKNKPSMSFADLMSGVGRGHQLMADMPGAKRFTDRNVKIGAPELELLEERYNKGWFQTPSGVNLKPEVRHIPVPRVAESSEKAKIAVGKLPDVGSITFRDPSGKNMGQVRISSWDPTEIVKDDPAAVAQWYELYSKSKAPPRIFNFDASSMPESIGRPVYQTLFDMMRAGNNMNYVDSLSPVNTMRRPGNLMSYGLEHGDYDHIPLFSSKNDMGEPAVFGPSYYNRNEVEREVMRRAVMPRSGYKEMAAGTTRDFSSYPVDAKTGLLALKELQMAKAHGPQYYDDLGAPLGEHYVFSKAHPMDMGQLNQYARRAREQGSGADRSDEWGPFRGMSPHLFGRVGTTEALLGGIQHGRTVEDIIKELLSYPGAMEAIRGRYAKGGLVSALQG